MSYIKKALEESQDYFSSRYNDEIEKTETADFSKLSDNNIVFNI